MKARMEAQDDVLLKRAAKGDEEAFTVLYRRHQAAVYRFAVRMTGSAWGAEEIVQDVFMTLIRIPMKYDPSRGSLGAFLYGIARNAVMKYLERLPKESQLETENSVNGRTRTELHETRTPAVWTERNERMEQVRTAVLALPAEFRETVVLCDLEELSYEEAAKRLECPIGTVRSRLHRGRALLLARLEMLRDQPLQVRAAR